MDQVLKGHKGVHGLGPLGLVHGLEVHVLYTPLHDYMTLLNSYFAVQQFNSEIVDFVKGVIIEPFFVTSYISWKAPV